MLSCSKFAERNHSKPYLIMTRTLLITLALLFALPMMSKPDEYDLRRAESYRREAEYYQRKADSYRREAAYYMRKAEGYQREAAYYSRRGDADRASYYDRQGMPSITTRPRCDMPPMPIPVPPTICAVRRICCDRCFIFDACL